ncbi:hypothetical protein RDV84_13285 [Lysobacter yananisis]|uniref:Uncharacterized protein n=1 Tax=Lysobacter yananisis TaxID=1003114 RepID=A0ABY9P3Q9_9GAMM|nr:hypothetical protein [Lysobacter yananisis]WMT00988.1 hypothetical protein RDV84_13285 [Lysobacter yananisis]
MRKLNGWIAVLTLVLLGFGSAHAGEEERLLVFVGEKISVAEFKPELPPNTVMMDAVFKAKFRVRQVVYGRYDDGVIEFDAYDHFGVPGFAEYPHSLLFVLRQDDGFVQLKYQYVPVFRTRSGEWNGCGPVRNRDDQGRSYLAKAQPVAFAEEAYLRLSPERPRELDAKSYPRRDFRIEGDRAYCLTGSSLRELFELKKQAALKDEGWFGGNGAAPGSR